MKQLLFSLCAATILFSACKKESSLENPDNNPGGGVGGGNPAQALLTRMVFVAGGDSVATDYTYDANKRLTTFTYATTGGGNIFKRIVRNSAGIMTGFITKSEELQGLGIDSLVTTLNYDNTENRYAYSTSSLSVGGVSYNDSTAYIYDGNRNLTQKVSYAQVSSATYEPYQKVEYSYGSGNVLSEKYYDTDNNGNWQLLGTYDYSYDSKINPIKLGHEAMIVLDDGTYFSNNNVISMGITDPADPSNNYSLTTTYIYNSADKPSSGESVETGTSNKYALRYYYN